MASNFENLYHGDEIAIIGLACHLPGANGADQLWQNLREGRESISFFSDEELLGEGVLPELIQQPNYVRARGLLDEIESFDAAFFGYTPREAEIMDPQQRRFLESAWEALEDAAYDPETFDGRIAVFASVSMNSYLLNLYSHPGLLEQVGAFQVAISNEKDALATRVSYKLNLKGPSVVVQTACSSALVAVHLACQSLLNGECEMALAGGVSIKAQQKTGYLYHEGEIFSPDGHCRAFDANAQGTLFSNGLGIVVLKRLEDALADGDTIRAVIKGSAINNDGAQKVGYTAPSVQGQARVIAEALAIARVEPETISYIEAHGTGTQIGDPIEITALNRVFRTRNGPRIALGSIKTNIGHLDTAAGVAGLLKTVLALQYGHIPPSLHFQKPNPQIDFTNSAFYINTALTPWATGDGPRRAGVSAFGIGGTNAHVVLEEAPPPVLAPSARSTHLVLLSARSESALRRMAQNLAGHLSRHPELALEDVAHTLAVGRRAFGHRGFVVGADLATTATRLDPQDPRHFYTDRREESPRPVVFLFPGQGTQHIKMGASLYQQEPFFRDQVDRCAEILRPHLGLDLRTLLYPTPARETMATTQLQQTALAQPALFVVAYALGQLWRHWGIEPAALIGHSLGEYVAACLAGVFTLEEALGLVAARGRLMQSLPPGAMLSISLPASEVQTLLDTDLDLAAHNGPSLCVVSGPEAAIARLQQTLEAREVPCRRLHTSVANHSAMLDPILARFEQEVRKVRRQPPTIPYISTLTGAWITAPEATDPAYWAAHLRQPVRFAEGLQTLLKTPRQFLLEVGPGRTLTAFAQQQPLQAKGHLALASLPHPQDPQSEYDTMLTALGQLWVGGAPVAWDQFYGEEARQRVPLPTYPFERQRFWIPLRVLGQPTPDATIPSSHPEAEALTGYDQPSAADHDEAPQTETEQAVAAIWQAALGIVAIGRHANFFNLGGHSLLATQVSARVRKTLQIELPLRLLFEHPTIASLASAIDSIKRSGQRLQLPPPVAVARSEDMPLSFAQQRLWFLDLLVPGNPFYNVPVAVALYGDLNSEALIESLQLVIQRHEVLRTTYHAVEGRPVQRIHPTMPLPMTQHDLTTLPAAQREAVEHQLIHMETHQPFDLTTGPLVRAMLLRRAPMAHILVLTMHHIVSDGWSMGLLVREVGALYTALVEGQPNPLPPLAVQYADFAHWQRQWLQGEVLGVQLDYWRQQLADVPVLQLPTDYARPPVETFQGTYEQFEITAELRAALITLSQQEGVTLFMTLLAAFQTLLFRYAHREDIAVGTSIANRTQVEIEGLIGFFVNMLVLRTNLSGNPTFQELLQRVREVALEAYANQDVPFEHLIEALQPARDRSHAPLFQVSFELHNTPLPELEAPGLRLSGLSLETTTTKYDLMLEMRESPDGIAGTLLYCTDLFSAQTIRRFLSHFTTLLVQVVADPTQHIADILFLPPEEHDTLLHAWNESAQDYPRERCFHHLFEAQVARTPQAVAARCGSAQLTYQQLNDQANALAHHLLALGVGPDELVPVLAVRSLEFLTVLLAILKAGAAYLPLDPSHPPRRLAQVLDQSQPQVVLSTEPFLETLAQAQAHLAGQGRIQMLTIETLLAQAGATANPEVGLDPQNLAYVIYTSGSTGLPKGAMVTHQGMVNHLYAKIQGLPITAQDILAQTASQCFDISVWQFFAALVVGGQVLIFPDEVAHDPARLLSESARQGVSILETVPSLLQAMLETITRQEGGGLPLPSLRWLVVTGEALPPELCRRWLTCYPQIPLLNAYGPTECSDDVTHHPIHQPPLLEVGRMPIGRNIINTQLYILDRRLHPVPIGVLGELYVGGDGVGRGYYRDVSRTAAVFLPDPFGRVAGRRLYKTGDLVRHLPDGTIEFWGRVDYQVKVRGFRIELGEIEAVLAQHPGLQENVVLVHEGRATGASSPQDRQMVAYIVPRQPPAETGQDGHSAPELVTQARAPEGRSDWEGQLRQTLVPEVRRFVQSRLPDYMVPAMFVLLPALPLNANGKIDRKALPAPESIQSQTDEQLSPPRTPTEMLLADIWREILGVAHLGLESDFFALGGHSLLVTQVVSRIRTHLGAEVPLRVLFESATLGALAVAVEQARATGFGLQAPPLQPVGRDRPLPLSFAQQRLWFLAQLEPDSPFYNISAAIEMRGRLDIAALQHSLSEIVRRHEVLRTTFPLDHGQPLAVINPYSEVEIQRFDLRALAPAERPIRARQMAIEEARRPFDLTVSPLLRGVLLHFDDDEYWALLTMHHIASDGWSTGILIREVVTLYEGFVAGRPSALPELAIQYGDYAAWQRKWLQSEVLETHLAYWRRQLAGAPTLVTLPTDRPRPAVQSDRGARHAHFLGPEGAQEIYRLCRQEGVTLFMLLLATFQVALHYYTGRDDLVVGSDVANRDRTETEGLIGFFVNQLVLRTNVSGNPTFRGLLARVRQVTLDAYAHQDLPFDRLVQALNPERSLQHAPLFQIKLVLQNMPDQRELTLPHLTLQTLDIDPGTSQLDLNIRVLEGQGGLYFSAEYNTDLFDAARLGRLFAHYEHLLGAVTADPTLTLEALVGQLSAYDKQHQSQQNQVLQATSQQKLRDLKRRPVQRIPTQGAEES